MQTPKAADAPNAPASSFERPASPRGERSFAGRGDRDRPDRGRSSFGGDRREGYEQRGPPEARPGDWSCGCGFSNFASRSECRQCGAGR